MDRFDLFRNRSIPKILRSWTATKRFLFVLFIFWRLTTILGSDLTVSKIMRIMRLMLIMRITVIKYINRYGCGLFNSCCGMKIFCISIVFKLSSFIVLMKKALTMISWNFSIVLISKISLILPQIVAKSLVLFN